AADAADGERPHEVLIEGTQDDDLNPYTVRGDTKVPRCPECKAKLSAPDAVCERCRHDPTTGQKAPRAFERIDKEWEGGWPFEKRIAVFAGLQVVNILTLAISVSTGYGWTITFFGIFLFVAMQAFLLGTWDKLSLTRTTKGKVTLTRTWRVCFVP